MLSEVGLGSNRIPISQRDITILALSKAIRSIWANNELIDRSSDSIFSLLPTLVIPSSDVNNATFDNRAALVIRWVQGP